MLYLVLLLVVVIFLPIELYARWEKRDDRRRRERLEDRETFKEIVFGDLSD